MTTTTRQSRTWPYDLLKAVITLILLGLMLYFRPDMGAMIQKQLGLPFGTITVLDTPQVTSSSPTTTLSGRTQPGATVDVFAGDAKLGTTTAGDDGTWSLPVTLPDGNYQLRAQARDAAGADVGPPAVLAWNSQQAAAQSDSQASAEGTEATVTSTDVAAAGADAGVAASTNATAESSTSDPSAASGATAAGASASTATSLEAAEVSTDSVTLVGSGQPGTTVEVATSGGTVGTATVGQDGAWTLRAQLAPGEHELQARTIDASGAQAGASPVLTVTVPDTAGAADTAAANIAAATADASSGAPAPASVAAISAGGTQDTAQAAAEGTTVTVPQMDSPVLSGNKAMLSGTAAPGATVEIVSNNKLLGRAVADADGSWTVAAQLKPGFHALQVRTRDTARTQVQASPVVSLTIPVAASATVAATGEFTAINPAKPVGTGALTATSTGTTAGTALATSTTITNVSVAEATTPTTSTTSTTARTETVTVPTAAESVAAAAIVTPTAASSTGPSTAENAAAPAIRSTAATTPTLSQPTPVATPAEANQEPSPGVTVTGGTAGESESSGGRAYVIQTGDLLSALAQEYLGDQARFTEIVAATNEMAKQDPSFGTITDPNLITLGQKIWIPAQ